MTHEDITDYVCEREEKLTKNLDLCMNELDT